MLNADPLTGEANLSAPGLLSPGPQSELKLHPRLKLRALQLDRLDEEAAVAIAHAHRHRRIHIATLTIAKIVEDDVKFPIAERAIEFHDEAREPAALRHGDICDLLEDALIMLLSEIDVAVRAGKSA